MSAEDRDLHSDLLAAYRQIGHLQRVIDLQTDQIVVLLDRKVGGRRTESGGLGAAEEGLDRRLEERRNA